MVDCYNSLLTSSSRFTLILASTTKPNHHCSSRSSTNVRWSPLPSFSPSLGCCHLLYTFFHVAFRYSFPSLPYQTPVRRSLKESFCVCQTRILGYDFWFLKCDYSKYIVLLDSHEKKNGEERGKNEGHIQWPCGQWTPSSQDNTEPRKPQCVLGRFSMPDKRMHNLLDLFLFLFFFS